IHEGARDVFAFRLLDRVAVKGKTRGIQVYELQGRLPWLPGQREAVVRYEAALDAYWRRDFAVALRSLESSPADPPSRVLAERCKAMLEDPPPSTWDGVHVATTK
ncbi:MAG TPA: adenylate/guanylate cyclase domain-containing protein, partial [Vicinamibacteria bacterium]|nr:adenylate/guanylate cyclase domain-containing protein [Vicinamibacteria bacterium]